jgi:hypothetical protein
LISTLETVKRLLCSEAISLLHVVRNQVPNTMQLQNFIDIVDKNKLEDFLLSKGLQETELWEILIYMKGQINLVSEILFLTVTETEDQLTFYKENEQLHQLFSVGHIVEELYDTLQLHNLQNSYVKSERLVLYALNDA